MFMMFNYELRNIVQSLIDAGFESKLMGNVYYRTKKGKLLVVDFVELDKEHNLILSESQEEEKL